MSAEIKSQPDTQPPGFIALPWWRGAVFGLIAIGCFHLAYTPARSGVFALAMVGYVLGLVQLARLRTTRQCFYTALATGFACGAPQLGFFWNIFGAAAIALWLVLALWIAAFVGLVHQAIVRLGLIRAALLTPFFWTGLEYFRSELYYLKFSWLNVGYAFEGGNRIAFHALGMYGFGFIAAIYAAWLLVVRRWDMILLTPFAAFFFFCTINISGSNAGRQKIEMGGIQMEFPTTKQIHESLDKLCVTRTNLDLIVLPEYTLDGEPTDVLKDWCRINQKFLIVGGKQPLGETNYYNTAFVISTNGEVVFKQVKSVPIQFFKDGLPAPEQKVWNSPWGKIGICICYDLSYTRVTDELVKQGAQMLIVPTMDVTDWGQHQHELHARVAPARAAEYGIPIFRVASSGISQGVERTGRVQSSAPFPGEGETIFFGARIGAKGSVPADRWLAPLCVLVTLVFLGWTMLNAILQRRHSKPVE